MIGVALWALLGAVTVSVLWWAGHGMFDVESLRRTNYRDAPIVTGVGVLVPVALVLVGSLGALVDRAEEFPSTWSVLLVPTFVAAWGFGALGLFDDVVGQGQSGGFRGHLSELARGRLTSGAVKLVAGAAVGVVVASAVPTVSVHGVGEVWVELPGEQSGLTGVVALLRDGAVVALAANLANLFDRAPGRVVKVSALGFAVCAAVSGSPMLAAPAAGIGAGLGLLWPDLRERCMLGDAGSNALGALCGLAALVAAPGATARWVLVVVLLLVNVASERVSFSKAIDAVPPLRWFDRLGSRRPG